MNTLRDHLYLAALLHDIGKFFQRSDSSGVKNSSLLTPETKKLEAILLPVYKGVASHKHCLWTAQFVNNHQDKFRELKPEELQPGDSLELLAATHHLQVEQQTSLGKIIKYADSLSAGMDRENSEARKDEQDEQGWDAFKRKRMTSILQDVGNNEVKDRFYLPLCESSIERKGFPTTVPTETDYDALWKCFEADFNQINTSSTRVMAENVHNLLFTYASSIPSSTINFPDVSLYDHSKTTAALAVCIYDYEQEQEKGDAPFRLIGGDLSGIQPYIYQIVSKHAAKNLKGRSFYLRMLSDAIVRLLLKRLNLYRANLIYNSGGSFYILAPNTTATVTTIEEVRKEIQEKLFKTFGTSLYVALDSVPVSEADLMHESEEHNLCVVWKQLFEKRDALKNHKFSDLLQQDYTSFFEPHHHGGFYKRDSVTGDELTAGAVTKDGLHLNHTTWEQIELGRLLKNARYMVVSEEPIPHWESSNLRFEPAGLGFSYYFPEHPRTSADNITVIAFNGEREEYKVNNQRYLVTVDGKDNIYGMEFYGGNNCQQLTFEQMFATDSEGAFQRLGVLRMDVDNLGALFQKGFAPEHATLSRYATLSRSLDYFFSGYLNTVQMEEAPESSQIIYSGGDDVFIVAHWEDALRIAERISNDFREYTCQNPAFSISGGIALVRKKYPIMKAAEYSNQEESRGKKHVVGSKEKNAVSFMNMPLNWQEEFPQVKSLKDSIVNLTASGKLPKSFISKVLQITSNAQINNHKIGEVKTYWMLAYSLGRMKSKDLAPACKLMIDRCIQEVCHPTGGLNGEAILTNYHPLELWAFAARWAELELRTNTNCYGIQ